MFPRSRTAAALDGFLYGAGSIGDIAGARLPNPGPVRPPGGAAADAAKLAGDAAALAGDARRAVRRTVPADVRDRVAAGDR